jgi:phosphoribosylaminoimidazole-succinocarboxamide synthase
MVKSTMETEFPGLPLLRTGKVRDIFDLGDYYLMVASDRVSAFDVIMPTPIPGKGIVLTQISLYWFAHMASIVKNHVVASNIDDFPEICRPYAENLAGRSMLVHKAKPLPIECVVRGYLSGSGWKSYQQDRQVCGIALPEGLVESDRLPEPIFTPSTKEEVGQHDINISFEETVERIGAPVAEKIRDLSLAIYKKGAEIAHEKGIIIADTKFEFGELDGEIILIDEVLTPDSSRFWPKDAYRPGGSQQSYDKQFVRDYLEQLQWNKRPPGPELPMDVVEGTQQRYREALRRLTGKEHGI